MPYNTSRRVVERNRGYLDAMVNARRTLTWPTTNPEKLAYRVREALAAARKYPEYGLYHELSIFYKIRVMSGWVEAEYIGPAPEQTTPSSLANMSVEEVEDANGVVGACIKFGSRTDELHFPNAVMEKNELHAVYSWGRNNKPRWKLIAHGDKGVTMTRKDVEEAFLWTPDDKE